MASALANMPVDQVERLRLDVPTMEADQNQSTLNGHSSLDRPQTLRPIKSNDNPFPSLAWHGGHSIWHPSSKSSYDTNSDGDDHSTNKSTKLTFQRTSPLTSTDGSPTQTSHSSFSSDENRPFQPTNLWGSGLANGTLNRRAGLVMSPIKSSSDNLQDSTSASQPFSKSALLLGSNPDVESYDAKNKHNMALSGSQYLNPWGSIREFKPATTVHDNSFSGSNSINKDVDPGRHGHTTGSSPFPSFGPGSFSYSQKNEISRAVTNARSGMPPTLLASAQPMSIAGRNLPEYLQPSPYNDKGTLLASLQHLNLGTDPATAFDNNEHLSLHNRQRYASSSIPNNMVQNSMDFDRGQAPFAFKSHNIPTAFPIQQSVASTRSGRSADGKSASPIGSEFRTRLDTPYLASNTTPPTGSDSRHSNSGYVSSFRDTHPNAILLAQRLHHLEVQSDKYVARTPLNQVHYSPASQYESIPMSAAASQFSNSNSFAVEQYQSSLYNGQNDTNPVMRSALLEDFRANNKSKRYELRDIFGHIVEFSGDQQGSRFLQTKLETANSDEKAQIFTEIASDSLQLMTDLFGNYVIQKLISMFEQFLNDIITEQICH